MSLGLENARTALNDWLGRNKYHMFRPMLDLSAATELPLKKEEDQGVVYKHVEQAFRFPISSPRVPQAALDTSGDGELKKKPGVVLYHGTSFAKLSRI